MAEEWQEVEALGGIKGARRWTKLKVEGASKCKLDILKCHLFYYILFFCKLYIFVKLLIFLHWGISGKFSWVNFCIPE